MEREILSIETMNLFFDESGTKNDRPTLMAGLSIPSKIYETFEFNELNRKLRNKEFTKLHWTDFTGYRKMRNDILEVFQVFSKYARFTKLNVINYNANPLDIRKKLYNQDQKTAERMMQMMIYTKIPERILYGLLRHYGKDVYVKSRIFIEHSRRFSDFKLDERILEQLNIQSMYRGEQFSVLECTLIPKRQEIGIELTDLLLGVIRQIIKNEIVPEGLTNQELLERNLKGRKEKIDLTIELLKNKDFLEFLSSIKYYEWESNNELKERNFQDYLTLFLASHHRKFEEPHHNFSHLIKRKRRRVRQKLSTPSAIRKWRS
ncbi:DUF3800 domain-containing protein [Anoxybacteroides tepidamans]|uniref:DUF3800 domain-containing protein n=1 Tax=Anoxybacteroides tepidamans TaxID=265948 RepID=UPI000487A6A7|nr:DUF3800 domain-containing protein [Anoxybacillus tepidamans]